MALPHCHSMHSLSLSDSAPILQCNYPATAIRATSMLTTPMWSFSFLEQFQGHSFLFYTSPSRTISHLHPFSLYNCGSPLVSHASSRVSMATTGDADNNQDVDAIDVAKLKILKQKCNGGHQMERSLSFHIPQNKDFAMWRCFRLQCSWAGRVFLEKGTTLNGVNQFDKTRAKQLTEENLDLQPLNDDLIAYFAERKVSDEVLQKNAVMQISGDRNVIAFTYRRNGVLVSCKYRSPEKKFWQEKGTEKILYGLDDIKEADDIIIVEGEIDKLSMEEAGFHNCVSVPDGGPQKVSTKELPPPEEDTRFQYIWNCKEYLDKASRIVLATDGDKPGQALAEELALRLGKQRCLRVNWPKKDEVSCFKDANEVRQLVPFNSSQTPFFHFSILSSTNVERKFNKHVATCELMGV